MQEQETMLEKAIKRLIPMGLDAFTGRRLMNQSLSFSPDLDSPSEQTLLRWVDSCLAEDGGQVAARARAAVLGRSFLSLSKKGRIRFLEVLVENYSIDEQKVEQAIKRWQLADPAEKTGAGLELRDALEPPRMKLLAQFNAHSEGVKFLVDMRAELLTLRREFPSLAPLEADLKRLLSSWFDIGLLYLEEMSWAATSAAVLEKLIDYEAVHEIQSWGDLKNRLDSDRRIFAFFHPNMPSEPLIFVEVALVSGMASSIQNLLDQQAPVQDIQKADTAIFYSISNAQPGLAGIGFGNFLIKGVVEQLQKEFPHLKQFATLSPIPGFCRWLEEQEKEQLAQMPGGELLAERGTDWLKAGTPYAEAETEAERRAVILQLAAFYLCKAKRRGTNARDPVAHFHLSNGAQVARLNWMADTSEKGLKQSMGLMVNYLYELPRIETRSQNYIERGELSVAAPVRKQLK